MTLCHAGDIPEQHFASCHIGVRSRVPISVPVMCLSSRDGERCVIEALDAGADDIVTKPARIGELLARPKARWRRNSGLPGVEDTFLYDRFRFDLKLQQVRMRDEPVELTQKEFQLALLLLRNIGMPLSRIHVREVVWGRDSEVPSRTRDTHVSRVRNKLALRPESGYLLAPVYSYGYRLEHLSCGADRGATPGVQLSTSPQSA